MEHLIDNPLFLNDSGEAYYRQLLKHYTVVYFYAVPSP